MRTVLRALLALSLLMPAMLVVPTAAEAAPDNRPTFIITLRSGEPRAVAAEHARRHGAEVTFVYEHALRGYAAKVSDGQIGALARDGRVARVERDGPVQASGTQENATWGLDRIDQRSGRNGTYTYNATGAGVTAYILDTGIRATHSDFGRRVAGGYSSILDGRGTDDCNGHGTHVAGTVGGSTYGVAKAVTLVPVRVLDCKGSGSWSGVIAGIDWVTAQKEAAPSAPMVANMSLGGGASSTVDAAVQRSINAGVSYAIAAGNSNANACNYSPARVGDAMTIGATTSTDAKASYSNYGSCVDLFAPGSSITSAWYTGDSATNTISGTSMATPHVAGAAALYLQTSPAASAQGVRDALFEMATKGVVTSSSSANNHLLYTLDIRASGTTPANVPPTASFTHSCSGLTCLFTDTSTDSDGTISAWSWTFGDGGTSPAQNPSRTYTADGTYTVTLTVTDDDGATGTASHSVTVKAPATGGITLSVRHYKVSGNQKADLKWSGATGGSVDVYRNNAKVLTTPNDGGETDHINRKGGGSHTYRVCNAGTSTCSPDVTVTF